MIAKAKEKNALHAIQYLVVRARKMAYDGEPHAEIAEVLDAVEYLPGLMCRDEDCTAEFRTQLVDLAETRGFHAALEYFDAERD
ncbi:MAG: hypothetical protein AAF735_04615 [Myxococcota bacterium]